MAKKKEPKVELFFSDDDKHEHVFAELFFDDSPLVRINIEDGNENLNIEFYDGYPECEGPQWKSMKLKEFKALLEQAASEVIPKKK